MWVPINHSWYVEVRRCLPGVNSFLLPYAALILNLCCPAWRQGTVSSDLIGSKFYFSLLLNKILLRMGTSFPLCIHQLMNIWAEPSSWLFCLSILCQYQAGFVVTLWCNLKPGMVIPQRVCTFSGLLWTPKLHSWILRFFSLFLENWLGTFIWSALNSYIVFKVSLGKSVECHTKTAFLCDLVLLSRSFWYPSSFCVVKL